MNLLHRWATIFGVIPRVDESDNDLRERVIRRVSESDAGLRQRIEELPPDSSDYGQGHAEPDRLTAEEYADRVALDYSQDAQYDTDFGTFFGYGRRER